MRIRSWILVAATAVVGTHAVRADQVTRTVEIRHAVRMDLACTGDMTPRRQALLQFLRARDFVAVDLAGRSDEETGLPANGEVMGVWHQQVIQLYAVSDGKHALALTIPPDQSAEARELSDAVERMVREKFDCSVDRVSRAKADAGPITAEHSAWVRRTERLIRRAASTNPAAR